MTRTTPRRRARAPLALAMFGLCGGVSAQSGPSTDTTLVTQGSALPAVTITGTREKTLLSQTPASIGVIPERDIVFTGPMHPQQLLGQVPGVAIAVTNGEGHSTAIRQPFTTSPLYLFLEDGIPTRATGFFNHNALYEVNLPAAGGVEVVRGPGSALYGSDAIAGTVNVLTRAPAAEPQLMLSAEAGSSGWRRLLADGSRGDVRASVNVTHTDGWRDGTAYDRQSANFRWDAAAGGMRLKTIVGLTHIDQQTGANTPLTLDDYLHDPTKNNLSIAWRKVRALRLSTQVEHEAGGSLWTLTPYLRRNVMDLNGSFNLSSDPRIETSAVTSLGLMAKWRRDFDAPLRPRLIAGVDLDRSPGSRTEDSIAPTRTGSGANSFYTGFTVGDRIYDYDVTFRSASAYLHGELSPTPSVRITAGLRHDDIRYEMDNRIAADTTSAGPRIYAQTPHASVGYSRWSPKLGATWAVAPQASLYASVHHGFRTPSESQLFRAGSGASAAEAQTKAAFALALKPIKARQSELGLRGQAQDWRYDLVAYELVKRDDLVSQRDLATDVTTAVNAGRTRHRGVELGLGRALTAAWRLDVALSHARHVYDRWVTAIADFSGKEMESAPRSIANVRLAWTPREGSSAQLEWAHIGSYWLEASHSAAFGKYPGHDVFNLRMRQRLDDRMSLFARVMNLADKRYADSASVSSNTAVYSPALPRSVYAGLEAAW
ncbi:TonB-dependent receptor [Piscinibacter sp. XHJ-5]|uniref:TonB-dependent receptor n=1 Tax=Piscinibacter sp. XHJ-5 TaxID=3037797 RepID=UPI0024530A29|nr:TonB-dependent receptor [Piscinibacter sp. XHJ-5]